MVSSRDIRSFQDVAELRLCCGCGVCAYLHPDEVEMVDTLEDGRRPVPRDGAERMPPRDLTPCPGVGLEHRFERSNPELIRELLPGWGPVLELWEGYASDSEIRFAGSSGGAASALALCAIEAGGLHGVLHTAARRDVPYLNETVMSRTSEDLLARTGSRYAPASPCDGLARIESSPAPCVFIGKPCDVAAARSAARERDALDRNLALTIAIFCAGTPSTKGTLELLAKLDVDDPARLEELRYRGLGWPGRARARFRDATGASRETQTSYEESWGGILERHRQRRCYVCADHTGEFADVAVGDPWYREIEPDEAGRSLLVVRTALGREWVRRARDEGYLTLTRVGAEKLPASQVGFEAGRGALWGRLLTLRALRAPAPRYRGFPMLGLWMRKLSLAGKARSILGTARRVASKGLRRRVVVATHEVSKPNELHAVAGSHAFECGVAGSRSARPSPTAGGR